MISNKIHTINAKLLNYKVGVCLISKLDSNVGLLLYINTVFHANHTKTHSLQTERLAPKVLIV